MKRTAAFLQVLDADQRSVTTAWHRIHEAQLGGRNAHSGNIHGPTTSLHASAGADGGLHASQLRVPRVPVSKETQASFALSGWTAVAPQLESVF